MDLFSVIPKIEKGQWVEPLKRFKSEIRKNFLSMRAIKKRPLSCNYKCFINDVFKKSLVNFSEMIPELGRIRKASKVPSNALIL